MAIQQQVWIKDIQDKLFAGADFIEQSTSHDGFIQNKTINIPQAGTIPSVEKDRSSLPGTIAQRTDTVETYNLAEYTTDPMLITNLEELQTSYDKRNSVLNHHVKKITERIGLEALYQWSGATLATSGGQIVLTTGTASTAINPPSSTKNTKGLTLADIASAAAKLDEDDAPQTGRNLVIPSNAYWNFVNAEKASLLNIDYLSSRTEDDIARGIVSKVYGFNIYTRSYTVTYTDAATPTKNAVGATAAATDVWGMTGWQEDMVAKALGDIKMFEDIGNPAYYGDVYSVLVMFAAKALRTDGKGIVTIVQDV